MAVGQRQDDHASSLLSRLWASRHTETEAERAREENGAALGPSALLAGAPGPDAQRPEGKGGCCGLETGPPRDGRPGAAPDADDTRGSPTGVRVLRVCLGLSASYMGGGAPHYRAVGRAPPGVYRQGAPGASGLAHRQPMVASLPLAALAEMWGPVRRSAGEVGLEP